ncbi:amidohydrolase family protein [Falsiroseomonas selenitidurans]|uniref:Amidohydrolase family protein n=1 Tax=Falsiroseomonas selenitidurans TaxID=2716335 RepID=A0ABX1EBW1_9PROT|nr:amidohydrolase family protein [Falsiroseomonas selenitidurans]NKC33357.1 amidohydrolase family protein [Falsiroseomonas selenitidurans]
MTDLLLRGGVVITMDPARRVLPDGAVAIKDGRIQAVGPRAEVEAAHPDAAQVIEARGRAILPGLIDGHAHAGHGLVKTLGNNDSAAWTEACRVIYTLASPPSFWRAEAKLAAFERLRFGVTTGVSLLGGGDSIGRVDDIAFTDAHAQATEAVGIRSILVLGPTRPPFPRPYVGPDGVERPVSFEQQLDVITAGVETWHDKGRVKVATLMPVYREAKHDPAKVKEIERQGHLVREAGRSRGAAFHQDGHRQGSIEMADRMFGLLGPDAWLSHCTELTEADIETLVRTGASVVHNPSAIAAVRGYCPAPRMMEAGITVMIGSDATAPDRSGDMFRHMFQCIRLHQRHYRDETVLPPGKALEMVTIDAARGLGLGHEIGSLEPGKLADVITVDLSAPHMVPANMPVARVVYFANGHDVVDVVVGGDVLMRNRTCPQLDATEIATAAWRETDAMLDRAKLRHLAVEDPGWGLVRR